jgi:hypothetical protein
VEPANANIARLSIETHVVFVPALPAVKLDPARPAEALGPKVQLVGEAAKAYLPISSTNNARVLQHVP